MKSVLYNCAVENAQFEAVATQFLVSEQTTVSLVAKKLPEFGGVCTNVPA